MHHDHDYEREERMKKQWEINNAARKRNSVVALAVFLIMVTITAINIKNIIISAIEADVINRVNIMLEILNNK